MASERALWQRLRQGVARFGDFQRIENAIGAGWPDVNFCVNGVEGHIELKHCPVVPPRSAPFTRYRGLEEEQVDWIERRVRNGGRVFIMAQIADALYLIRGNCASSFNQLRLDEIEACACWQAVRTVSAEQWAQFIVVLTNKSAS